MVRAKVRKHMYWHPLAQVLLEHGLQPKYIANAIKRVYPQAEVTGRHIGAYKRRLTTEGKIEGVVPSTIGMNEALSLSQGLVSEEDMFVYECHIGAAKRTLKCFEMKLMIEAEDELDDIEYWITTLTQ